MKRRRRNRSFSIFLQVLAVLLSLHIAGIAELAARLGDDPTHEACSNEQPGRDCPPGCPSCTCAHGPIGSMPSPAAAVAAPALPLVPKTVVAGRVLELSTQADLPHVFRPPRA